MRCMPSSLAKTGTVMRTIANGTSGHTRNSVSLPIKWVASGGAVRRSSRCYARVMARTTGAAAKIQARVLRVLADEVEAGRRRLSPELTRVLASEMEAEGLSPQEWSEAWGAEIDRRLASAKAGAAKSHDLGAVL